MQQLISVSVQEDQGTRINAVSVLHKEFVEPAIFSKFKFQIISEVGLAGFYSSTEILNIPQGQQNHREHCTF